MPAGNTAVVSFPNTGAGYGEQPVSKFKTITSSFSENMNATSKTSAWAAYDLWFNNWGNEVMIQYDFTQNGDCGSTEVVDNVMFNGQAWHLCDFASPGDASSGTVAWKLGASEATRQSESSGTIDLLAMTKWLETHTSPITGHTYLPAASTWTALSSGWEICSTGGQNETFTMSNFSVNAS